MTSIPLLDDDFERIKFSTQIDALGDSSINRALTTVAQEVSRLIQQLYPSQADSSRMAEAIGCGQPETIGIRAIELLTVCELEVLQLIVDEHSNSTIAENCCFIQAKLQDDTNYF